MNMYESYDEASCSTNKSVAGRFYRLVQVAFESVCVVCETDRDGKKNLPGDVWKRFFPILCPDMKLEGTRAGHQGTLNSTL